MFLFVIKSPTYKLPSDIENVRKHRTFPPLASRRSLLIVFSNKLFIFSIILRLLYYVLLFIFQFKILFVLNLYLLKYFFEINFQSPKNFINYVLRNNTLLFLRYSFIFYIIFIIRILFNNLINFLTLILRFLLKLIL